MELAAARDEWYKVLVDEEVTEGVQLEGVEEGGG
jgi:hypothetical protein